MRRLATTTSTGSGSVSYRALSMFSGDSGMRLTIRAQPKRLAQR
jgi:hypothetical protein